MPGEGRWKRLAARSRIVHPTERCAIGRARLLPSRCGRWGSAGFPYRSTTDQEFAMTTVIQQEPEAVRIPAWLTDLASFRRWAKSDDFPQRGWYAHLGGDLWVDPSMERMGHNQVKAEIAMVLGVLVKGARIGRFFADRMLLTNVEAELSTEPDGMFLSYDAITNRRGRLEQREESL